MSKEKSPSILPRFIRLRDAPFYLGMDRNRFNSLVRPKLTEVPIGKQGIAFDRLDLDAWADDYIIRNGRLDQPNGGSSWDAKKHQDSSNVAIAGTSTNKSEADAFAKALAKATLAKRKSISPAKLKRSGKPLSTE
ncbi:hypothetical protein A1507_22810 [Methylomonas koyamae]|uniref:Uncharacterized protein n=1 Tax=Methylomonas koyamae TaxID=702114 RepID=A0A177NRB3_9GAMM|nr:hypothetical protein A1507_22810 [Methylomonas koyamae]